MTIDSPQKITCRVCGFPKDLDEMRKLYGKPCKICIPCDGKERIKRYKKKPRSRARQDRINQKQREWRRDLINTDKFIYVGSRKNDKNKGRQNDLTREFIRMMISKPCQYCGDSGCRMTLDRIDNSIGHLQSNVVPCCVRCNYIRRDIPYEAWLIMIPAIKQARIAGSFGDWDGSWVKSRG